MRNRTLLSILVTMALLYYAFPQLPVDGGKLEVAFSIGWICFAIIAIGGNLAEFLYTPNRKKKTVKKQLLVEPSREKQRMF